MPTVHSVASSILVLCASPPSSQRAADPARLSCTAQSLPVSSVADDSHAPMQHGNPGHDLKSAIFTASSGTSARKHGSKSIPPSTTQGRPMLHGLLKCNPEEIRRSGRPILMLLPVRRYGDVLSSAPQRSQSSDEPMHERKLLQNRYGWRGSIAYAPICLYSISISHRVNSGTLTLNSPARTIRRANRRGAPAGSRVPSR